MSKKTELPARLRTLKQIEADYGGSIKACSLRAEFLAGNLHGYRARESCNSAILISDEDLAEWFGNHAGKRQASLSPKEAKEANAGSPKLKGGDKPVSLAVESPHRPRPASSRKR